MPERTWPTKALTPTWLSCLPPSFTFDQLLLGTVGANFQALTPETLMAQVSQPKAGFQAQVATPEEKKTT
jgi:hypothetical protein